MDANPMPMPEDDDRKRDDETGRYTDKYPREDIRETIRDLSGTAATSEIADALNASRNSIYKKLVIMEDDDEVESRMAGGIRVWSVSDDQNRNQNQEN